MKSMRSGAACACLATLLCPPLACRKERDDKKPSPAPPGPDAYEANDTLGTCRGVIFTPPAQAGDPFEFEEADLSIHGPFDEDYFRFDFCMDGALVISMNHSYARGDIDIQLLSAAGQSLDVSSTTQDTELIIWAGIAESYAVRVWSPDQHVNAYGLQIQLVPVSGPFGADQGEPNDTLATCTPGGTIDFAPFNASSLTIHDPADVDYFCFDLTTTRKVAAQIAFCQGAGNLNLELFNTSGTWLAGSYTLVSPEVIAVTLPQGSYAIRVFGAAGAMNRYYILIQAL